MYESTRAFILSTALVICFLVGVSQAAAVPAPSPGSGGINTGCGGPGSCPAKGVIVTAYCVTNNGNSILISPNQALSCPSSPWSVVITSVDNSNDIAYMNVNYGSNLVGTMKLYGVAERYTYYSGPYYLTVTVTNQYFPADRFNVTLSGSYPTEEVI